MQAGLDQEIVRRLEPGAPDDPNLGQRAHALISVSGSLSFTALSLNCAEFEQICLAGGEAAPELARIDAAGADARRAIEKMRTARP